MLKLDANVNGKYIDKSMKIGILPQPLRLNFGGLLQNFALQYVLKKMGHEVDTIDKDYRRELPPLTKRLLIYLKRFIKRYVLNQKKVMIRFEAEFNKSYPVMSQYTQRFIDKYISVKTVDHFRNVSEGYYDAFIAGSDQVWRGGPNGEGLEDYFFDFAKSWNIKRVAYAASFGTDYWYFSAKYSEKYVSLIRLFDAVSLREKNAADMIACHWGIKACHVLDPTMLLDASVYHEIAKTSDVRKDDVQLLIYILDSNEEKEALINRTSTQKKLSPYYVNAKPDDIWRPITERIQPPVEFWLKCFMNAQFIITDSFHACVFSILFHKEFVVVGNQKRGLSRMKELLQDFRMEDRLIDEANISDFDISSLHLIDYTLVDKILNERRRYSLNWLMNSLNDKNE